MNTFGELADTKDFLTLFNPFACFSVTPKPSLATFIEGSSRVFQSTVENLSYILTIPSTEPGTPDAK